MFRLYSWDTWKVLDLVLSWKKVQSRHTRGNREKKLKKKEEEFRRMARENPELVTKLLQED